MARYVLGDGGHGRLISLLTGADCLGIDDPVPPGAEVFIGVGDLDLRRRLFEEFGNRVLGMLDESAIIASDARVGFGLQAMPRSYVSVGCRLGVNVLLNTGAQIDHDCTIGDHCVLAPAAVLCGGVTLGDGCFVGAGAIILQEVTLEPGTFVPAATLVVGPYDFRRPQRMVRGH